MQHVMGALTSLPGVRLIVVVILRQLGIYVWTDYGVVAGGSTVAAANTTAMIALWLRVATASGLIFVPSGTFGFNATALDHNLTYGAVVSILGMGGSSIVSFYGTTGPFWYIGSNADSAISRTFIRNVRFHHAETPTSGATLQLGWVGPIEISGVTMPKVSTSLAPINPVRLVLGATAVSFDKCKFETQTTGSVNPVCLDVAVSAGNPAGLSMHNTDWSGYAGRSVGIRFSNSTLQDTVYIGPGTLIKDHLVGIQKNGLGLAGTVQNLTATGLFIDGVTSMCVQIEPFTGATIGTWKFGDCWFAGVPVTFGDYGFFMSESNGGSVIGVNICDSYFSNLDTCGVYAATGVDDVMLLGNIMKLGSIIGGGNSGVEFGGTSENVTINDNQITVFSSAFACITVGSVNCDPLIVQGNILRGSGDADGVAITGALSASRIYAAAQNAYKA